MKKAQKKTPPEVWRLDGDDLTTMPFNTAIWLYFNMKSTQTAVLSGFYASEANKQTGRTYIAWNYLNNHLIFLERLIETLEPETKAFYMVEMQIANLTADIERGSNG